MFGPGPARPGPARTFQAQARPIPADQSWVKRPGFKSPVSPRYSSYRLDRVKLCSEDNISSSMADEGGWTIVGKKKGKSQNTAKEDDMRQGCGPSNSEKKKKTKKDNKRGSSTDGKGGATVEQKEVHEEERQTTKVDSVDEGNVDKNGKWQTSD
ncbi:hypothetical protein LSAT2_010620 [Lamellibrachia satsuma]|nr:hypothetical protein LSAT2_010620 [Lamellibrachia satsuma]